MSPTPSPHPHPCIPPCLLFEQLPLRFLKDKCSNKWTQEQHQIALQLLMLFMDSFPPTILFYPPSCVSFFPFWTRVGDTTIRGRHGQGFSWRQSGGGGGGGPFLSAIITSQSQSDLCQLPWRPSSPPPWPAMPLEFHTGDLPQAACGRGRFGAEKLRPRTLVKNGCSSVGMVVGSTSSARTSRLFFSGGSNKLVSQGPLPHVSLPSS